LDNLVYTEEETTKNYKNDWIKKSDKSIEGTEYGIE